MTFFPFSDLEMTLPVLARLTMPPKLEDWLLTGQYRLRAYTSLQQVRKTLRTMADDFEYFIVPAKKNI